MDETSPVALYLPVELCLFLAEPFMDEVEMWQEPILSSSTLTFPFIEDADISISLFALRV